MTHTKLYLRDTRDGSNLLVVDQDDDGMRMKENRDNEWHKPFWMPESEFYQVANHSDVEVVGDLSDDQFEQIIGNQNA